MSQPCTKEADIEDIRKSQNETRDILIQLKTLVESLVQYQLSEQKNQLKDHEARMVKLENISVKIIAWASVGGVVGGFIVNIVSKRI